ncbi:hypothetical protein FOMPIDRAFT_1052201 [Fomitopsis schrenkii]|uniref:Uncharacterized protein n=1 Tax=Fomitopsis schrenkii TaxID=2126942 RepID=S8FGV8_FOMSC|nr:hypothetical protein FOMPIDRAFT_1052201 [Fomitopsis schrenkii]
MPIIAVLLGALLLLSGAFRGSETLQYHFGKMQHSMGAAVQSLRLPAGLLFDWNFTPPGSSLTFDCADFTAVQYLDRYPYNDTSFPRVDGPLYIVSFLEWFVENEFAASADLLGPGQDSWFEINEMSPWIPSEDSSTIALNWTDSRLRCYVEVDWPMPSRTSTVAPLMSITQMPESTVASTTFTSATEFFASATMTRCFIGKEYVASATGTLALPTAVGPKNDTPSPVHGASLPVATDPVASFVSEDDTIGGKREADFVFVFWIMEAVRKYFDIPQHKFYPVIADEEKIEGEFLEGESEQELDNDNEVRLAASDNVFEWDNSSSVTAVLRAEAGLGASASF